MEIFCTRPRCPRPQNYFADLDDNALLRTAQQKFCTTCGMPLILVGRYLPTKVLGRGGFGAAFLARDRYTPGMRQCVVKQFQPAGNLSPTQMQLAQDLFEREAVVLENIGNLHEQIPELYAFFPVTVPSLQSGQEEQLFYLVQEYIDGQNLEQELDEKGKFSEQEASEVLREILKVLEFVHSKGIIHRDIKPSNIMRRRDGKLFLLDFGAVKQVANTPGANSTSTGIYSLGFAPPEQMAGGQVYPSTDLYALAVMIVMLITREKDVTQLFDAYSNQWKWRDRAHVSPRLADTLDKMLQAAANQRFGSAQEVLQALSSPQLQVKSQPKPQPVPQISSTQAFSTIELLVEAAFSGFEGGLIGIALFSLLKSPITTFVICAVILAGLIFAQSRRWIEKFDLLIISTISLAIIFFVPLLHSGLAIDQTIILALGASLITVAVTALFRLIYRFLSMML